MSDLSAGLASTANEPVADNGPSIDTVLDTAFETPSEPAASSDPSANPDPVEQPVAATQQPQSTEQPKTSTGEPPRERWDSILANARTKAREEALAENRDHLEVVAELKRDYVGTVRKLVREGSLDPRFAAELTAEAASILNASKQTAKANAEPEPDLQTADGALVYSADQLRKWNQWNQTQTTQRLTEQFKPLQELQQQFEKHQQQTRDQQQVAETVSTRWSQWESMPFMKENIDAIKTEQVAIYKQMESEAAQGLRRMNLMDAPFEALQQAYAKVVSTHALPKLQSAQTDSLVAAAQRKRAASSSDPAAMAPAQPRKARTEDEALEQVFGA